MARLRCILDFGSEPGGRDRPMLLPGRSWRRVAWIFALIGLLVLLVVGWKLFWFLTDDAYIAFRYISNSQLGNGYTWNPPPFRPVEGYTSFAWVLLLDLVWRVIGMPPPAAANPIALLCAGGSLLICLLMGMRMRLPGPVGEYRHLLLGLALLGTVTNRTFLAWTSSGLETSLFNFLLLLWLYLMIFPARRDGRWVLGVCATASLVYLTRPEGLLCVLGTILAVVGWWQAAPGKGRVLLGVAPLLLVPAHLIWRRLFYGAWLPNTYYAKQAFWPESGLRYLFSFVMEYFLWIWLGLLLVWAVTAWRRLRRRRREEPAVPLRLPAPTIIALGVLLIHFGYYTFVFGGDHFEYRIYSHLVPLLFLGVIWLLARITRRRAVAVVVLSLAITFSYPIPWTHWAATRKLKTRQETWVMVQPVARRFPALLRPYVALFDRVQERLIEQLVCVRHQEHKIFHRVQLAHYPSRKEGARVAWRPHLPVLATAAVGVVGWVLPHVAIIDLFGLNDFVIARNRGSGHGGPAREMAHNRFPPEGYVECFAPNVKRASDGEILVYQRTIPFTEQNIVTGENEWWARFGR